MITKLNVRFSKYIAETDKAYLLAFRGREMWIPKCICWDLQVSGNDLHAWAILPSWKFKEITGKDPDEIIKDYGTSGLREKFDAQIFQTVDRHTPQRIKPVINNTIKELKK